MVHVYYRNAAACLLVCDLAADTLISDIKSWHDEVSRKVLLQTGQKVPTILCCNKVDMTAARQKWLDAVFKKKLEEMGFDAVIATSAFSGEGVD